MPLNGSRGIGIRVAVLVTPDSPRESIPFFTPLLEKDIEKAQKAAEVSFFLIHNPWTMDNTVLDVFEPVARSFLSLTKFYVVPDLQALKRFGLDPSYGKTVLVVSREFGQETLYYKGPLDLAKDVSKTAAWVKEHKDPLVPQLEGHNQAEIFNPSNTIVLALVDPEKATTEKEALGPLREAAKAWAKNPKKGDEPVKFVWLDGVKWAGYTLRVYHIGAQQLPRLLIVKPKVGFTRFAFAERY
jgi:hypothetical protein